MARRRKVISMKNSLQFCLFCVYSLLFITTPQTFAENPLFPDKPIKVIVPQPPGGGFDFVGRVMSDKLSSTIGQALVVDNKIGSGTLIGTDFVAKASADGYTVLVGSVSNIVMNSGLYKNLPYDPIKDFEPIGLSVSYSYTLVGRKDLPFKTLKELIQYAKDNPNKLSYASSGNGSGQHVLAAALWHNTGVQLMHIPYRGAQAAYTDILGGRVDLFFDIAPTAKPHVEAGSLIALATSGAQRNPNHPNVPTIIETGVDNLSLESWFGFFAPSKTPKDVLDKWRIEFQKAATTPEVRDRFEKAGGKPISPNLIETKLMIKNDTDRWVKLIKDANIKSD